MSVANQLFSFVIHLRPGLLVADVCVCFGVSEGTYSCLFTTWIYFLSKEFKLLFHFLHVGKSINGRKEVSKRISLIHRSSLTATRLRVNVLDV